MLKHVLVSSAGLFVSGLLTLFTIFYSLLVLTPDYLGEVALNFQLWLMFVVLIEFSSLTFISSLKIVNKSLIEKTFTLSLFSAIFLIVLYEIIVAASPLTRVPEFIYSLLLISIGYSSRALLKRHKKFHAISKIEIIGTFFSVFFLSIIYVVDRANFYIMLLVTPNSIKAILFFIAVPITQLNFRISEVLKIGFFPTLEKVITSFQYYLPYLLINQFLGPTYVGLLSQSSSIVSFGSSLLSALSSRTFLPLMRVKITNRLSESYQTVRKVLAYEMLLVTAFICSISLALPFLPEVWSEVRTFLFILGISAILRVFGGDASIYFMANNRYRLLFNWRIFWCCLECGAIYLSLLLFSSDVLTFLLSWVLMLIPGYILWQYLLYKNFRFDAKANLLVLIPCLLTVWAVYSV